MRTPRRRTALFFYTVAVLLFLCDISSASVCEKPFLYSLLGFYILQLAGHITVPRVAFCWLLLAITSLLRTSHAGLFLLYVLPATALGILLKKLVYDSPWYYIILVEVCLIVQLWGIEYLILRHPVSVTYTISILFVNMIVTWIVSLKSQN